MKSTTIPAALIAFGALACDSGDSPIRESGTQVRDSAGIRIVENPRPPVDSRLGWRVGPAPVVTIGTADGEEPYLLQHAIGATRLSDGRIVVADYGSMDLRFFDGASGTHLATVGGAGEGPGEFGDLMDVERLPGDSIMAWGFPLRASVFDPDGRFVRGFRLERRAETTVGLRPIIPVGAMADGSILASVSPVHIDTLVVELWDGEGDLRAPLGSHPAHEPRTWVGGINRTQTFGWDLKLAPWGELAVVTGSKRYEIMAFATDGTLARIVRAEHVPRAPTEADIEAYIEVEVQNQVPDSFGENVEAARAQARRDIMATPVAEHFPAFASIMSDRTGHLWVEEYEVIGEESDGVLWTVFDPNGHVLGFVETPEGLTIYEIGEDYILARAQDELGVESVQLWPLERGERASPNQFEDSAGVVIVENAFPGSDSRLGWEVGPEPSLSIGTAEGTDDFQLHGVDDALKLSDGRILVANGGSHELLVFDEAGDYLEAWGQRGEGPGDFGGSPGHDGLSAGLFWMERWPGDSLAVCHGGPPVGPKHFVSVLDTRGRHGRRLNLAGDEVVQICRDLLPGGAILASRSLGPSPPHPPEDPVKGLYRRELELFIVSGDGSSQVSLGPHPGAETFWHWEDAIWDGTAFTIMQPPFQRSLVWAVWGELVVVAPTERYEFKAYRQDGSLARIVRRENDVRSPTQADLDGYRAAEAPEGELTNFARNRLAAWNALPLAESFPAISAIEVDLLDNLWVREYNLPGEEGRALWTVFDPDGLVLGFVETPPELVIYEIGEDYILGKVRDELGVEYVQVRGLDRSG